MKPEDIEQRYTKGQTIVERGSRERVLYVVRSGNVLVHVAEGQAPYLLGPGDMFGEAPAILGRPSPVRAEAEGDTSVLALDVSLLNVLVRENAEFSFRLIAALAERVGNAREEASAEAVPLEGEPPRTAVRQDARSLAALARSILARRIPGEVPTPVRGRLMDLAAASHLPIRQAYLCLQELLDRRLIGLVDDQLTVLEPDELAAVAQKPG
ncbi:MAG TPA: cyclic nucleotide-binding domain-containing protein [Myxococcota bacterium]|nr:cyclic nucleotide-binding domain-containing protein [Myxococcota bacterium]